MFDEPTAGMSVDEVPVILDMIAAIKAARDKTILLVEHKMDVVRSPGRPHHRAAPGRLVADGEPADGDRLADRAGGLSRRRRGRWLSRCWSLRGVKTHIGRYHILHGVDFAVPEGGLTMLLGRNGAGKTTTLAHHHGPVAGERRRDPFDGRDIATLATPDIARLGIAYVPETMGIFAELTVQENLMLATARDGLDRRAARLDLRACSRR